MPCHCKRQPRLMLAGALDRRDEQRGCVENEREGCDPGLIIVLLSVIADDREGKLALQKLGRPALPLDEKWTDRVEIASLSQTTQQFTRCWRRTGPCIE